MLYSWISLDFKNTIFKHTIKHTIFSIFKMAVGYHDNIKLAN